MFLWEKSVTVVFVSCEIERNYFTHQFRMTEEHSKMKENLKGKFLSTKVPANNPMQMVERS